MNVMKATFEWIFQVQMWNIDMSILCVRSDIRNIDREIKIYIYMFNKMEFSWIRAVSHSPLTTRNYITVTCQSLGIQSTFWITEEFIRDYKYFDLISFQNGLWLKSLNWVGCQMNILPNHFAAIKIYHRPRTIYVNWTFIKQIQQQINNYLVHFFSIKTRPIVNIFRQWQTL